LRLVLTGDPPLALRLCQRSLSELLLGAGQEHLFAGWAPAGTDDDKKHAFFDQIQRLHQSYPAPGGLNAYLGPTGQAIAKG
jgi:hypothetical protein